MAQNGPCGPLAPKFVWEKGYFSRKNTRLLQLIFYLPLVKLRTWLEVVFFGRRHELAFKKAPLFLMCWHVHGASPPPDTFDCAPQNWGSLKIAQKGRFWDQFLSPGSWGHYDHHGQHGNMP